MPKGEPFVEIIPINWHVTADKLKGCQALMSKTVNDGLRDVGDFLTPKLADATPVGVTGKLKQYTVYQVVGGTKDEQRLEIRQSAFSNRGFPYGVVVRGGALPHRPPTKNIQRWVEVKLMVDASKSYHVATLIATAMSVLGIKGQQYQRAVWDDNRDEVFRIMDGHIARFVVEIWSR